ncbi:stage V sporulation protein AB [Anaerosalibacter massiliensis]|uniref:Stage V sporulation protein AB n=1 Tax=Anaerosalibacter massiliensis TaxID=1347392 RepID=A0A9X2MG13_9FIRM|nr:stage V sporulation protein AB [Anaerosalibacter massiliensis]MCR2042964.1 stage V sporulation protein AB [Anaerosalibacter massiliensis]
MLNALLMFIGVSGGIVVGNAAGAFISLLGIVPRLAQISDTDSRVPLYQWILIISATMFSFIFFSEFSFKFSKYLLIILGLFFGTFVGLFASALAEVLNVIPVLSRKMEIIYYTPLLIISIVLGKVSASLLNWLVLVNYK